MKVSDELICETATYYYTDAVKQSQTSLADLKGKKWRKQPEAVLWPCNFEADQE